MRHPTPRDKRTRHKMFNFRQAGTGVVVPVPSGIYTATLLEVEERTEGGFGNKGFRIWKFAADVNGQTLPVDGITGRANTNHEKNRSYQWLTAIMGEAPQLGVAIDPIGRKCLVTVGQKDGYPRVEDVKAFSDPQQVLDGVPR